MSLFLRDHTDIELTIRKSTHANGFLIYVELFCVIVHVMVWGTCLMVNFEYCFNNRNKNYL